MDPLTNAKRIVVKVGSALLVDAKTGDLRQNWLRSLAADIGALKGHGIDVVLVSSGSIALGRNVLGLNEKTLPLEKSQAAAAVGQIQLARAYEVELAPYGITTAQVLLTLDDSANRKRYLNARATLAQLLSLGVVPIVNENDTVATDEIRYGDNDRLAAQIAVTIGADRLILLSDIDGLYTANPSENPDARHIPKVSLITPEIEAMAGDAGTGLSKGGMKTKIMAAKTAMESGCAMAITLGSSDNPLKKLDEGAKATWFYPSLDPKTARKKWILSMKPKGQIAVDTGAARALQSGKSLLPAGVSGVEGEFERGDAIAILGPDGSQLAAGLTRFNSEEARLIMGRQTADMESILGYPGRTELVHRDDMVT